MVKYTKTEVFSIEIWRCVNISSRLQHLPVRHSKKLGTYFDTSGMWGGHSLYFRIWSMNCCMLTERFSGTVTEHFFFCIAIITNVNNITCSAEEEARAMCCLEQYAEMRKQFVLKTKNYGKFTLFASKFESLYRKTEQHGEAYTKCFEAWRRHLTCKLFPPPTHTFYQGFVEVTKKKLLEKKKINPNKWIISPNISPVYSCPCNWSDCHPKKSLHFSQFNHRPLLNRSYGKRPGKHLWKSVDTTVRIYQAPVPMKV